MLGFLSHKAIPVSIKKADKKTIRFHCYSATQEIYCSQVAPQQCLFPLQLPEYKGNIFF
jgi:hypothetical protein